MCNGIECTHNLNTEHLPQQLGQGLSMKIYFVPNSLQSRDAPEAAPRKSGRSKYVNEMKPDGSGFMTQKGKEWVIRIQLLQLQSPDPSNDDYYYQVT